MVNGGFAEFDERHFNSTLPPLNKSREGVERSGAPKLKLQRKRMTVELKPKSHPTTPGDYSLFDFEQ